jgi:Xaa-Pro dipeptidase
MSIRRRNFINLAALAASGYFLGLGAKASARPVLAQNHNLPNLGYMAGDVVPITLQERKARIEKAQSLLRINKMGALVLDCGTSLDYFTGIKWWPSERTMVAIIPANGPVKYVCPAFEESRLREQIVIGQDVYTWQEDESPYALIAKTFKDSGVISGPIGVEEEVRFFIADGMHKAAPHLQFVSGDPVSAACRMIKSPAEIALMQKASDITLAAIKVGVSQLREGMSPNELAGIINKAQGELGGAADFALCLFGEASAFPHGTKVPVKLKKGDMVLMDCGCRVEGYCSDITRTVVFGGEPTKRQQEIWNLEKKAQAAGFAAAQIGAPCENVDAAARKVITDAGFGPDYKLPGLPHRTGHGIGMDGHEWGNMVRGNKKLLEPGMCFSIEPTIAIVGEFGVRMEDCVFMTEAGPKWFTPQGKSIFEPFG